jgi:hypothetical protein
MRKWPTLSGAPSTATIHVQQLKKEWFVGVGSTMEARLKERPPHFHTYICTCSTRPLVSAFIAELKTMKPVMKFLQKSAAALLTEFITWRIMENDGNKEIEVIQICRTVCCITLLFGSTNCT